MLPGAELRSVHLNTRIQIMNDVTDKKTEHVLTIEDLKFDPPRLPASRLQAIAKKHFNISGSLKFLEGERDQNCHITGADGRQYVLKISGASEDPSVIDFQIKALLHIERTDPTIQVPRVVRGENGGLVYRCSSIKGQHQLRMLTYLPGIPYQRGPRPSLSGTYRVGAFLARLNRALQGFSHPAAGHFMPWDSTNGLVFRRQLRELLPDEIQVLIAPVLQRLHDEVYPLLPCLRSQVIHHDGHDANLLRAPAASEEVVGIIDFGDMIYGPIICDLAIGLADFVVAAADPAAVAAAMCRGFHSVLPLQPEETDLLLDLVMARQILVLQLFEFRRRNMEHPPQFVISDPPHIIASLNMLAALDRTAFRRALREALI